MELIIISYMLALPFFGLGEDARIHPNVVRVPLGGNSRQHFNGHSQRARQAIPISPPSTTTNITSSTPPPTAEITTTGATTTITTTTSTPNGENLSCSQTIQVTSDIKPPYHFVVDEHNAANLHCVITIFGQRGKQLLLQLTEVDLQPGLFDCEIDSVQVYTLSDGKLSFKDKFCNLSHPSPEILTENNVAVLTFNSGSQLNEQGFMVQARSVLLPDEGDINSGYTDTGYGDGSGSYTGYVSDFTSYNPPVYSDYSSGYTNTSYNKYRPPNTGYANGYFNVTHAGYKVPQYAHYGPPVTTNYQNVNGCDKVPWKITGKPEISYGAYIPPKSHLNNELYTWLISATKRNNWSKEIYA